MQSDNPAIYLFKKMWEFSAGNRPKVILYFLMSIGSNCVGLCGPLILAHLVNKIQENQGIINGGNILSIYGVLWLFLLLTLATWSLHGPSRVMEMKNSFKARANYKMHLFDGVITLPLKWHSERHS